MPASVPSPLSSTLPIQLLSPPFPSCLALWPASLTAEQACFYKAAVKRGESRYGRSWGLFRRSKILHRSVYSALWLGGLRCRCRRQTNGPLTARCPCEMVLGKKIKKILSAPSVRRPTGKMPGMPDYQSSPVHSCVFCLVLAVHESLVCEFELVVNEFEIYLFTLRTSEGIICNGT